MKLFLSVINNQGYNFYICQGTFTLSVNNAAKVSTINYGYTYNTQPIVQLSSSISFSNSKTVLQSIDLSSFVGGFACGQSGSKSSTMFWFSLGY